MASRRTVLAAAGAPSRFAPDVALIDLRCRRSTGSACANAARASPETRDALLIAHHGLGAPTRMTEVPRTPGSTKHS